MLDLPVEWETTTLDILFASARCLNQMTSNFNPKTSLLMESFSSLGLERRLRRYEQIRDVMNSWDKDTQNTLTVMPTNGPDGDQDLEIASVPRSEDPPNGFTLYLYHSHKAGKWSQKYITLTETGQMYVSKKPDFKVGDKDSHTICHLSDFDIYSPTESRMRRHLKPPKKFCYAIKSQQKTAVFMSMENYVHYFCAEDVNLAQRFYALVHSWRSWYLVNRRVEVAIKKQTNAPKMPVVKHKPKKSVSVVNVNEHRLRASVDEAPYTPGQFSPLLHMKRFHKSIDEFGNDFLPSPQESATPLQRPPFENAFPISPKKTAYPQRSVTQPKNPEFQVNGLLGESYEARKRDDAEKKREAQLHENLPGREAFTKGKTLLNMASSLERSKEEKKPEARSWFPSAAEHSARVKAQSEANAPLEMRPNTIEGHASGRQGSDFVARLAPTGVKPSPSDREENRRLAAPQARQRKPLVDLSPKYQEAPQWRQERHGIKAPSGTYLVDLISTGNAQGGANHRSVVRRDLSAASGFTGHGGCNGQQMESEARRMHRLAPSARKARSKSVAGSDQGSIIGGSGGMAGGNCSKGKPPVPPLLLRSREIEIRRPPTRDGP